MLRAEKLFAKGVQEQLAECGCIRVHGDTSVRAAGGLRRPAILRRVLQYVQVKRNELSDPGMQKGDGSQRVPGVERPSLDKRPIYIQDLRHKASERSM